MAEPREPDDFDRIVEGLDLDLQFPDDVPVPLAPEQPVASAPRDLDDEPDEEPFYRRVEPRPMLPRHRGTLAAWAGVLGVPVALILAALLDVWISPAALFGAGLIFVASSIYLVSRLPERGPSQRDWPDDGAVL